MAPKPALTLICLFLLGILTGGCTHLGHYPANDPLNKYEPGYGYSMRNIASPDNS